MGRSILLSTIQNGAWGIVTTNWSRADRLLDLTPNAQTVIAMLCLVKPRVILVLVSALMHQAPAVPWSSARSIWGHIEFLLHRVSLVGSRPYTPHVTRAYINTTHIIYSAYLSTCVHRFRAHSATALSRSDLRQRVYCH